MRELDSNSFFVAMIFNIAPGVGHLFIENYLKGSVILLFWVGIMPLLVHFKILFSNNTLLVIIIYAILILFCMFDVYFTVKKYNNVKLFPNIKNNIKRAPGILGKGIFTYFCFLIGLVITLLFIYGIIFLLGWLLSMGGGVASLIADDFDNWSGSSYNKIESSELKNARITIDYPYKWQGAINTGDSSYSIEGFGSRTEDVESPFGILSANAQKMDGSREKITLCIRGQCQSSTASYGIVSLSARI